MIFLYSDGIQKSFWLILLADLKILTKRIKRPICNYSCLLTYARNLDQFDLPNMGHLLASTITLVRCRNGKFPDTTKTNFRPCNTSFTFESFPREIYLICQYFYFRTTFFKYYEETCWPLPPPPVLIMWHTVGKAEFQNSCN